MDRYALTKTKLRDVLLMHRSSGDAFDDYLIRLILQNDEVKETEWPSILTEIANALAHEALQLQTAQRTAEDIVRRLHSGQYRTKSPS